MMSELPEIRAHTKPEPPPFSKVVDGDGDVWMRYHDAWYDEDANRSDWASLKRPVVAEHGEDGVCRDIRFDACGGDVTFGPDPAAVDFAKDATPVWLCRRCREALEVEY